MEINENKMSISVIGGDSRQKYAGDELKNMGYDVRYFAFDSLEKSVGLKEALESRILLFPVPVMSGEYIKAPFSDVKTAVKDISSELPNGQGRYAFGVMLPQELKDALDGRGYKAYDLSESESFSYLNAVPTAEGAIAIAMSQTPLTLFDCSCAVLGYGRIGKCLSRRLYALGSRVTVFARKEKDIMDAVSCGFEGCDYNELEKRLGGFNLIFNTVPYTILFEKELSKIKEGTCIIELASGKGCADPAACLRCGTKIIPAPGLPGKAAPMSAGRIIAKCMDEIIRKE